MRVFWQSLTLCEKRRQRIKPADASGSERRWQSSRFVAVSEASWQTMMREFPAAHVVTGLLPREDAAVGLAEGRSSLLRRLTGTLCLSGMYAIAEIVERDGTHIQCALASASDADQLAEAVGASDIGCHSRWASRRRFLFDDAAAKAMEQAFGRRAPAEAISPSGKPLPLP